MPLLNLLFRLRLLLAPPETRRNDVYGEVRKFIYHLNHQGLSPAARQAARQVKYLLFRMKVLPPTPQSDYARWVQERKPTPAQLESQKSQAAALPYQPLITIIIPVFNPSPPVLQDTLASIAAQTYSHWECRLMDGGSTVPGIGEVLREQAARDPRFRVHTLGENRGISGNINAARPLCRGEFIAVVDHDDLVAPELFFELALKLNEQPGADIIYFDEDKVTADGKTRHSPWFKPSAWSPDLLLSTNYLMHGVFRRSLLEEVDWFDPSLSGAQDWDLALRCTRKTRNLAHIPKVLYHWRQVPGSAAADANAKPWAFAAQRQCLENHLQHLGPEGARVEFPALGQVRVLWPTGKALVSIIIPTKDKVSLLRPCLETLLTRTLYPRFEIILIDTGSTDPETGSYYQTLEGDPRIRRVDFHEPFNFSRVNNRGADLARGELLLFLNNDTEILDPDWLDDMAGWAKRPEVGVVGAKLIRPNGTLQHAGIIMGLLGHGSHIFDGGSDRRYTFYGSTEWYRNYLAVTGACLMMRRQVFEAVGGFDPAYEIGYGDIELCLRTYKKGYRIVYTPYVRLVHQEGGSRGFDLPPGDVLRASLQMYPVIHTGDPFFNPNLSYLNHQPSLYSHRQESREDRILKILEDFNLVVQEKTDNEAADPFFTGLAASISPENWPVFPSILPPGPVQASPEGPRLLMVSADLSLSGAPLMLWMLAKHLLTRRPPYRIQVLSSRPGPLEAVFSQAGIAVTVHQNIVQDSRWCAQYMRDQDLVVANTIVSWRAVVAAKALEIPCLWWIHESKYGWRQAHFNQSIARAFPLAQKIVFPCEATRRLFEPFSSRGNYITIPNGLEWGPIENREGEIRGRSTDSTYKLVSVGSIEPRKGQDILLRALRGLPREIRQQTECLLVGRCLNQRFLKKLLKLAVNLENLHFLGEIPRDQVRRLLKEGDVFILPSRDEVFPTSLLEALAEGKGVIASEVGGVSEIVEHERQGLLFKAEDHRALARHITRFFKDREFLQACGVSGREKFNEKFTFERFAEEMEGPINSLLALGPRPPGKGEGCVLPL
jgi:glycosyltransferase involved in cell wall biosynthesis